MEIRRDVLAGSKFSGISSRSDMTSLLRKPLNRSGVIHKKSRREISGANSSALWPCTDFLSIGFLLMLSMQRSAIKAKIRAKAAIRFASSKRKVRQRMHEKTISTSKYAVSQ